MNNGEESDSLVPVKHIGDEFVANTSAKPFRNNVQLGQHKSAVISQTITINKRSMDLSYAFKWFLQCVWLP
jgi:hypothetical protein